MIKIKLKSYKTDSRLIAAKIATMLKDTDWYEAYGLDKVPLNFTSKGTKSIIKINSLIQPNKGRKNWLILSEREKVAAKIKDYMEEYLPKVKFEIKVE